MTTNTTNHQPPIDWQARVAAWRESGLPMSRYCQQQGLATHQLGYYKRKFEAANQLPENVAAGFAEVVVSNTVAEDLTLRFPNGLSIEGVSLENLSLVTALARALS